MKRWLSILTLALFGLAACGGGKEPEAQKQPEPVKETPSYRVAWSHYTGWEPWGYADSSGILKKWADKYGIKIELTLINDYVESINQYTAGTFDACVMTNMDALTIPAVGGVDSEAIIVGDFSNGNDGIVMKGGKSVKDLKGRTVNLVELSVSHYLLARALDMNGMSERDIKVVNTSDADIAAMFVSADKGVVVTWNPPLMQVREAKGATMVFDSSKLPGEIMDLMVVKTAAPESLKKALTGAWYETMAVMTGTGPATDAALDTMAKQSATTVESFKSQLATTAMFYDPAKGAAFAQSADVGKTMEQVRQFSFSKGLFGQSAKSVDEVGIALADGTLGNKDNVKLRFTAQYMQMAADGKL